MAWGEPHTPPGGRPSGCGGEGCVLAFPHAPLAHTVLDDGELSKLARQGLFIVSASTVEPPDRDETTTDAAPAHGRRTARANPEAVQRAVEDARAALRAADAKAPGSKLIGGRKSA